METLALESDLSEPVARIYTAADFTGKGGVVLWRMQGPTFTVVVFQAHDEPHTSWGVDRARYDMIELRVISARSTLKDFWKTSTKRLTHWKRSWTLICTDPKTSLADFQKDMSGIRVNFLNFEQYEDEVEKAIDNAQKAFDQLAKTTPRKPLPNQKPWAAALRNNTGDDEADRFWVTAVYPDGDFWSVKIHRGMLRSFGFLYPASWENGYVFDSFKKADDFAKQKMKAQTDTGYAPLTDPKTLRTLKWSLQHVEDGGT